MRTRDAPHHPLNRPASHAFEAEKQGGYRNHGRNNQSLDHARRFYQRLLFHLLWCRRGEAEVLLCLDCESARPRLRPHHNATEAENQ